MTTKKFVAIGLIISAVVAGVISYFASSHPDGLEKVSGDKGLDANVVTSPASNSFLADYGIDGIANSTGIAGLIGVLITALVGYALIKWVSKPSKKS